MLQKEHENIVLVKLRYKILRATGGSCCCN